MFGPCSLAFVIATTVIADSENRHPLPIETKFAARVEALKFTTSADSPSANPRSENSTRTHSYTRFTNWSMNAAKLFGNLVSLWTGVKLKHKCVNSCSFKHLREPVSLQILNIKSYTPYMKVVTGVWTYPITYTHIMMLLVHQQPEHYTFFYNLKVYCWRPCSCCNKSKLYSRVRHKQKLQRATKVCLYKLIQFWNNTDSQVAILNNLVLDTRYSSLYWFSSR